MEQFKHLDAKTIELAGIAASIAGGCRPCLDFHFKKALEIGCTIEQVTEAVKLGKMIKQRPINDISKQADMLFKNHSKIMQNEKNPFYPVTGNNCRNSDNLRTAKEGRN